MKIAFSLLLIAFFVSSAMARNTASPEVKVVVSAHASVAAHSRHAAKSEDVPLLFLAIMGLGMLTLSHTRPSSARVPRVDAFCAGKNVAAGKELPESAVAAHAHLLTD